MVKIVTDSSCDLSLERCAELGVEMLPITVNFGEESYRANVDLTTEDFYEKLAQAKELPHTAQITPAQFQEIFKPYKESGDEVVCLFISSKMSGTLQSARVAKNILEAENILLPDTLNVTFALGLLVEEAVKMRDAGMTGAEIVSKVEELIPRIRLFAMIEDLKYLEDGRAAFRHQRAGGQHSGHLPHHHSEGRTGGGGGQGPGQEGRLCRYPQACGEGAGVRRLLCRRWPCQRAG